LFALLLAFLALAFAGGLFFRAKFSVTRLLPHVGTAGQPLRYRVRVKNLTAKNQAGLALLEDLADPRPAYRDWRFNWPKTVACGRSTSHGERAAIRSGWRT
jgi:hypothetical protein